MTASSATGTASQPAPFAQAHECCCRQGLPLLPFRHRPAEPGLNAPQHLRSGGAYLCRRLICRLCCPSFPWKAGHREPHGVENGHTGLAAAHVGCYAPAARGIVRVLRKSDTENEKLRLRRSFYGHFRNGGPEARFDVIGRTSSIRILALF